MHTSSRIVIKINEQVFLSTIRRDMCTINFYVSYVEYSLFYRAHLQKRFMILRSLLIYVGTCAKVLIMTHETEICNVNAELGLQLCKISLRS